MKQSHCYPFALIIFSLFSIQAGFSADEAFFRIIGPPGEDRLLLNRPHSLRFSIFTDTESEAPARTPAADLGKKLDAAKVFKLETTSHSEYDRWPQNREISNIQRLVRAEMLSLSTQVLGMGFLQAVDAWHTEHRPFSDARDNLRRAWTEAPAWDADSYFYNYIGHPYTGAFTYNLMRSQNASPVVSWLFSCSQSLIWEFTLEATEQHPSIQDLLLTSNIGSLMGEGIHRLTAKLRENGLTRKERLVILVLNPAHLLNNGFR